MSGTIGTHTFDDGQLGEESRPPIYLDGPVAVPLGTRVIIDYTMTGRTWEVSS